MMPLFTLMRMMKMPYQCSFMVHSVLDSGSLSFGNFRDFLKNFHHLLLLPRFSSITINLGPTFLSGSLASNVNVRPKEPSCPLVQVLNKSQRIQGYDVMSSRAPTATTYWTSCGSVSTLPVSSSPSTTSPSCTGTTPAQQLTQYVPRLWSPVCRLPITHITQTRQDKMLF